MNILPIVIPLYCSKLNAKTAIIANIVEPMLFGQFFYSFTRTVRVSCVEKSFDRTIFVVSLNVEYFIQNFDSKTKRNPCIIPKYYTSVPVPVHTLTSSLLYIDN